MQQHPLLIHYAGASSRALHPPTHQRDTTCGMKSSYTVSNCVSLPSFIAESTIAGNETQPFDDNRCNENHLEIIMQ